MDFPTLVRTYFPTVNVSLNATAAVLLIVGFALIRRGREQAHKRTMIAAFAVSTAFLVCYVVYHLFRGHVSFSGPSPIREIYLAILASHILLAMSVPVLAIVTLYYGWKDRRTSHRRIARWTWPIWLYVSITGVIVYVMLYHLYPSPIA